MYKPNSTYRQKKIMSRLEELGHTNVKVWWEELSKANEMCGLCGGFFFESDQYSVEPIGISMNEALDYVNSFKVRL